MTTSGALACDGEFATEAQREQPAGPEYPMLCRRHFNGDVCTNPPMEWRARARKFEGALALAIKAADRARAQVAAMKQWASELRAAKGVGAFIAHELENRLAAAQRPRGDSVET